MPNVINGTSTGSGGLITSGDDSGILNIQTNETTAIAIDASQRVAFVAGTAALPAITTTGDTNTGIFFPAADTIAFSEGGAEAARIDSSGNFALGSTTILGATNRASFTNTVSAKGVLAIQNTSTSGYSAVELYDNSGSQQGAMGWGNASVAVTGAASATYFYSSGAITFLSGGTTERARIDSSGNLLVGTTSTLGTSGRLSVIAVGGATNDFYVTKPSVNQYYNAALFLSNGGSTIGYIQCSTTATTYSTSSDYRLKHDIQPMTGALAKVALLKPVTYKWNSNNSESQGFIAHELAEVIPDAVTGEKDAVNKDGSIKPQGIDTSFLVATLTAAIQEQQAIIESLTQRITALEGAE